MPAWSQAIYPLWWLSLTRLQTEPFCVEVV